MGDTQPILAVKNVLKIVYKGLPNQRTILKGVNLEVYPGEFVILYGASGSGKSTLLKIMASMDFPDEGEVVFEGQSLQTKNSDDMAQYRLEKLGLIFSQFTLIPSLTVRENVSLPDILSGQSAAEVKEKTLKMLEDIGLIHVRDILPDELSSGQRQKIGIARALMKHPKIILVNEPTRNLDAQSAKEVMDLFADLNRSTKMAIFMISQNPEYVYYPHRVLYLKDGRVDKEVVNRPVMANMPVTPQAKFLG